MKYIYRLIILLYVIFKLLIEKQVGIYQIVILLAMTSSYIFRLKYKNMKGLIFAEIVTVFFTSLYLADMTPLFALSMYDLINLKMYAASALPLILTFFLLQKYDISNTLVLMAVSGVFGYVTGVLEDKEKLYREMFDKEREYNYELERTRKIIMNSAKDAARIAEINERNRIAREIHDNVGHSIAGSLMQLRAADKLIEKGDPKGKELLKNSVNILAESLDLLRNTVHNIKPTVSISMDYIKEIINNFKFCTIDFTSRGDISKLSSDITEAIIANLKELLTNASKYSKATKMDIDLDINEKYVRLYVKDNGVGCANIKEGMGIAGIRERISNLGGSVAVSGKDGFTVVCLVGRNKNESINSR